MKNLYFLALTLFMIFSACSTTTHYYEPNARNSNLKTIPKPPMEAGKCYAKCLAGDYVQTSQKYPIYNGETVEDPTVEKLTLTLSKASTKWIKKKADKNCYSRNPDDCLVWCLVEEPSITKTIFVVTDTINNKNFDFQFVKSDKPSSESYTWKEVVCEPNINDKLISKITMRLIDFGYDLSPESNQLSNEFKDSIKLFQKSNGLAVGGLTKETLSFMGIKI